MGYLQEGATKKLCSSCMSLDFLFVPPLLGFDGDFEMIRFWGLNFDIYIWSNHLVLLLRGSLV